MEPSVLPRGWETAAFPFSSLPFQRGATRKQVFRFRGNRLLGCVRKREERQEMQRRGRGAERAAR